MIRFLFFSLLLVVLLTAAWLGWRNYQVRKSPSIAASGGREMSLLLPELGRTYLQNDPLWRDQPLGNTKENLGGVGCAVCSVAMAATSLGFPVTPAELNTKLTSSAGFTPDGWLIWSALSKVTNQTIEVVVAAQPTHAGIDAAISRGEFPVIKFILPSGITHWVVIVGKDGLDYLIRDPLKASEKPLKLGSRIYSVRFVRRRAP